MAGTHEWTLRGQRQTQYHEYFSRSRLHPPWSLPSLLAANLCPVLAIRRASPCFSARRHSRKYRHVLPHGGDQHGLRRRNGDRVLHSQRHLLNRVGSDRVPGLTTNEIPSSVASMVLLNSPCQHLGVYEGISLSTHDGSSGVPLGRGGKMQRALLAMIVSCGLGCGPSSPVATQRDADPAVLRGALSDWQEGPTDGRICLALRVCRRPTRLAPSRSVGPVSYTHLTLPTSDLV